MKHPALLLFILLNGLAADAQTIPNYKKPLFVSHLSGYNKLIITRPKAPKHNAFSRTICFKYECRRMVGWTQTQQRNKFKGYKKPGIPRLKYLKEDSLRRARPKQPPVVRDTVSSVAAITSEPIREDSVVSFVFNDVLFDLNSSHIKGSFTSQLDSVSNLIRKHKNYHIEVIGHTDNSGNEKSNIKLSQDRAEAVANYLISTGIDGDVIIADGRGSREPIANNGNSEGRRKNRRVEILLRFH